MIIVILLILIIACLVWVLTHEESFLSELGLIAGIICLTITGGITLNNIGRVAELETSYKTDIAVYEQAITRSSLLFSQQQTYPALVEGSIERLNQAKEVSQRIVELRNLISKYNMKVASMKAYNRNIFTGLMIPDEVEELGLIKVD